jgi:hypothetical protein
LTKNALFPVAWRKSLILFFKIASSPALRCLWGCFWVWYVLSMRHFMFFVWFKRQFLTCSRTLLTLCRAGGLSPDNASRPFVERVFFRFAPLLSAPVRLFLRLFSGFPNFRFALNVPRFAKIFNPDKSPLAWFFVPPDRFAPRRTALYALRARYYVSSCICPRGAFYAKKLLPDCAYAGLFFALFVVFPSTM